MTTESGGSDRTAEMPLTEDKVGATRERQGSAMCGRLRVGKDFSHVAGLVGAAMCSAC